MKTDNDYILNAVRAANEASDNAVTAADFKAAAKCWREVARIARIREQTCNSVSVRTLGRELNGTV